jgi:pyridoxal 5'-phosphate synthase pdxT subunit
LVGTPRIGVLALQGDVREHTAALRAAGAEPAPVRRPEHLDGLDGLVLPGGESTTMGRLLRVFELLEPLRGAVRDGLPVYGSCAGMILLAREVVDGRPDQPTVGGLDVTVRRNAFGTQVDSFEADLLLRGVGEVHGVFIRAPWVEQTGAGVEVLATVPEGAPAAGKVVAVRQGPLLATSFHPELTGDGRVHALFVDMVKEASS